MGRIYLSHSHPIAIYACPISWDVSHGIAIGMTLPWTRLQTLFSEATISHAGKVLQKYATNA